MQHVKAFIQKHRFQIQQIGAALGVTRQLVTRRLIGKTAWTVPEVIKFYDYLIAQDVTVDLAELVRMCDADYRSE